MLWVTRSGNLQHDSGDVHAARTGAGLWRRLRRAVLDERGARDALG